MGKERSLQIPACVKCGHRVVTLRWDDEVEKLRATCERCQFTYAVRALDEMISDG